MAKNNKRNNDGDQNGKGKDKKEKDYEVGYGKPPKEHQFQKGQSGNRKGRTKGSRGLKTDLNDELNATIAIKFNGKLVKGTTQRLAMRTLAARAATGDVRAIKLLTDLIIQVFGPGDRGGDGDKLSKQDQQLLERYLGLGAEGGQNDLGSDDGRNDDHSQHKEGDDDKNPFS